MAPEKRWTGAARTSRQRPRAGVFPNARFLFFFIASASVLAGTPAPGQPRDSESSIASGELDGSSSALRSAIERYREDLGLLNRSRDLPFSAGDRALLRHFHRSWLERLARIDFASLDRESRVDFCLLHDEIEHALARIDRSAHREGEVRSLLPFAARIVELEEARRRLERVDGARVAEALVEVARGAREAKDRLGGDSVGGEEEGESAGRRANGEGVAPSRPRPALLWRAARASEALLKVLARWHRFYDGYDPRFTWWTKAPFARAEGAMKEYAEALRERAAGEKKVEDALVGDPIGRDALLEELRFARIAYSPEELIELAEEQFAWCDRAFLRAARDLGFGEDWRRALDRVKEHHQEPGEQPRLIRELARESVAFLDARELITIPPLCRGVWRMEMMTPEQQRVNPYFTGGEVISVSFPTDGMSHEEKVMSLRGNNVHFARATVHHELIPGHFLQSFMTRRHRAYRELFRTPFWVEGWALYWELRFWDLGFARSAEDRIGMLFWRRHRCARIIFSLRFHLGELSAEEAVDYLVRRVGHERRNARAEVRRSIAGDYGPLYQAAYMIGGLELRALWRELVGAGRMGEREFHDTVLEQNAIPIERVREALGAGEPAAGAPPGWRFRELLRGDEPELAPEPAVVGSRPGAKTEGGPDHE